MKAIIMVFLVCLFSSFTFAQVENATAANEALKRQKYFQDFMNFASNNSNESRLDIFIQVPYKEVLFARTKTGFLAEYKLSISIFSEDKKKLIAEKIWTEKILTKNFNETNSKSNYNLSMRSFYLQPAKYLIRTSLEDKESNLSSTAENFFTVRNFSSPVSISDIMLISHSTESEGAKKIIPNITRNVATQKTGIDLFYEVYSIENNKFVVNYSIVNKKKELTVFSKTDTLFVNRGKNQIFASIVDSNLSLGNFLLVAKIYSLHGKELATVSKKFYSEWTGVPSSITDIELAVDQLLYIATSSEIDYIKSAPDQNQMVQRYLEFWKRKDPTPRTEENEIFQEYYRRITYADENFNDLREGWRSDRGMVFIILGPPDNVERHPYEINTKPYEIWEYYDLNKSFTFLDETGFGDYRLITPLYGDFYRYRQ